MSFEFTIQNKEIAKTIIAKYPDTKRFSAIMPLLTLAQKQNQGNLDSEIIDYLAEFLRISPMALYEVANFYSMYRFNKVGKYHFQFCKSVVCLVVNYQELYDDFIKIAGLKNTNISKDGLFSASKVECLGACVNAPAIKVNDTFFENVTKESLKKLVEDLKQGKELKIENTVQKSATFSA